MHLEVAYTVSQTFIGDSKFLKQLKVDSKAAQTTHIACRLSCSVEVSACDLCSDGSLRDCVVACTYHFVERLSGPEPIVHQLFAVSTVVPSGSSSLPEDHSW